MYLIETENELKELKLLLRKCDMMTDIEKAQMKDYPILKALVRRFGKLEEVVSKESFDQILKREELEYFDGMDLIVQWVGYREFVLHKQLTPTLSSVIGLEWDFEIVKELAWFLTEFYEVEESETCYKVQVKPFLRQLGDGDFEQLTQDFSLIWSMEENLKIH